MVHSKNSVS